MSRKLKIWLWQKWAANTTTQQHESLLMKLDIIGMACKTLLHQRARGGKSKLEGEMNYDTLLIPVKKGTTVLVWRKRNQRHIQTAQ